MKILKVVVINILVFIVLLFILDFIFAVIDTKQYFRIIIQNSHTESTRPQKVSALRILAKTIDRISYYYFRKDYKIFCSKNDFREPSCGKFYKNKNMIIAGCSYTYGDYLDYKDTLGVVLTEHLKDYKVYNIGLSGASPRETLYILRNCDEFTKQGILPENRKDTKYFLYTFINDQNRRLLHNVYKTSPDFKICKTQNGETFLQYSEKRNIFERSFIYKYVAFRYDYPDESSFDSILSVYMKEIEKEVNRIYPNAQVIFLVYSLDTPKLETKNTKIIELDTSLLSELFSNPNYLASDGGHPNRNAWEKIVPILINKVGMK